MIEQTTIKTLHLERTSETNAVPADWAVAEIQRRLASLPADERRTAMLLGWAGNSLTHEHRMSDTEYAHAMRAHLAQVVSAAIADGIVTEDEMKAMAAAAANRPTASIQGGGGPGDPD